MSKLFTIGEVKLKHGDCMDYLRSLPDKAFDLAVVDPPYGGGNQQDCTLRNGGGWFSRYKRSLTKGDTEEYSTSTSVRSQGYYRETSEIRSRITPPHTIY